MFGKRAVYPTALVLACLAATPARADFSFVATISEQVPNDGADPDMGHVIAFDDFSSPIPLPNPFAIGEYSITPNLAAAGVGFDSIMIPIDIMLDITDEESGETDQFLLNFLLGAEVDGANTGIRVEETASGFEATQYPADSELSLAGPASLVIGTTLYALSEADLQVLESSGSFRRVQFRVSITATPVGAVVPEPGSLALLGVGGLGLVVLFRRKGQARSAS